jgi:DNA-binding transcriptional regulator YhcF (GntR family)
MAKLYDSKIWLHKRYVVEKKTIKDMAQEASCSHMTIQRALEKHGLVKNQRRWTK